MLSPGCNSSFRLPQRRVLGVGGSRGNLALTVVSRGVNFEAYVEIFNMFGGMQLIGSHTITTKCDGSCNCISWNNDGDRILVGLGEFLFIIIVKYFDSTNALVNSKDIGLRLAECHETGSSFDLLSKMEVLNVISDVGCAIGVDNNKSLLAASASSQLVTKLNWNGAIEDSFRLNSSHAVLRLWEIDNNKFDLLESHAENPTPTTITHMNWSERLRLACFIFSDGSFAASALIATHDAHHSMMRGAGSDLLWSPCLLPIARVMYDKTVGGESGKLVAPLLSELGRQARSMACSSQATVEEEFCKVLAVTILDNARSTEPSNRGMMVLITRTRHLPSTAKLNGVFGVRESPTSSPAGQQTEDPQMQVRSETISACVLEVVLNATALSAPAETDPLFAAQRKQPYQYQLSLKCKEFAKLKFIADPAREESTSQLEPGFKVVPVHVNGVDPCALLQVGTIISCRSVNNIGCALFVIDCSRLQPQAALGQDQLQMHVTTLHHSLVVSLSVSEATAGAHVLPPPATIHCVPLLTPARSNSTQQASEFYLDMAEGAWYQRSCEASASTLLGVSDVAGAMEEEAESGATRQLDPYFSNVQQFYKVKIPWVVHREVLSYHLQTSFNNVYQPRRSCQHVQGGLLLAHCKQMQVSKFSPTALVQPILFSWRGDRTLSNATAATTVTNVAGTASFLASASSSYFALVAGGERIPYRGHKLQPGASARAKSPPMQQRVKQKYASLLWVFNQATKRWRSVSLVVGQGTSKAVLVRDILRASVDNPSPQPLQRQDSDEEYQSSLRSKSSDHAGTAALKQSRHTALKLKEELSKTTATIAETASNTTANLHSASFSIPPPSPSKPQPESRKNLQPVQWQSSPSVFSPEASKQSVFALKQLGRRRSDSEMSAASTQSHHSAPSSPGKSFHFAQSTFVKRTITTPITSNSQVASALYYVIALSWFHDHTVVLLTARGSMYCLEVMSREPSKESLTSGQSAPAVHHVIMLPPGYSPHTLEVVGVDHRMENGVPVLLRKRDADPATPRDPLPCEYSQSVVLVSDGRTFLSYAVTGEFIPATAIFDSRKKPDGAAARGWHIKQYYYLELFDLSLDEITHSFALPSKGASSSSSSSTVIKGPVKKVLAFPQHAPIVDMQRKYVEACRDFFPFVALVVLDAAQAVHYIDPHFKVHCCLDPGPVEDVTRLRYGSTSLLAGNAVLNDAIFMHKAPSAGTGSLTSSVLWMSFANLPAREVFPPLSTHRHRRQSSTDTENVVNLESLEGGLDELLKMSSPGAPPVLHSLLFPVASLPHSGQLLSCDDFTVITASYEQHSDTAVGAMQTVRDSTPFHVVQSCFLHMVQEFKAQTVAQRKDFNGFVHPRFDPYYTVARFIMQSLTQRHSACSHFLLLLEYYGKELSSQKKGDPQQEVALFPLFTIFLFHADRLVFMEWISRLARKLEPNVSKRLFPVIVYDQDAVHSSPRLGDVQIRSKFFSYQCIALFEMALKDGQLHHASRLLSIACESVGGCENHVSTVASLILALELLLEAARHVSLSIVLECIQFCARLESMLSYHSQHIFGTETSVDGRPPSFDTRQKIVALDSSYIFSIVKSATSHINKVRAQQESAVVPKKQDLRMMTPRNGSSTATSTATAAARPKEFNYYLGAGIVWIFNQAYSAFLDDIPVPAPSAPTITTADFSGNVEPASSPRIAIPAAAIAGRPPKAPRTPRMPDNGISLPEQRNYESVQLLERSYGLDWLCAALTDTSLAALLSSQTRHRSRSESDGGINHSGTANEESIVEERTNSAGIAAHLLIVCMEQFMRHHHYTTVAVSLYHMLQDRHTRFAMTNHLERHYGARPAAAVREESRKLNESENVSDAKIQKILLEFRLNRSLKKGSGMATALNMTCSPQYLRRVIESELHYDQLLLRSQLERGLKQGSVHSDEPSLSDSMHSENQAALHVLTNLVGEDSVASNLNQLRGRNTYFELPAAADDAGGSAMLRVLDLLKALVVAFLLVKDGECAYQLLKILAPHLETPKAVAPTAQDKKTSGGLGLVVEEIFRNGGEDVDYRRLRELLRVLLPPC